MREGASSGASLRSGSLPRAETTSGSLMIDDLRHALDAEPLELAVIVFALILCATTWLGSEACCQRGKGRYAALVGERRILRRRESVSTKGGAPHISRSLPISRTERTLFPPTCIARPLLLCFNPHRHFPIS